MHVCTYVCPCTHVWRDGETYVYVHTSIYTQYTFGVTHVSILYVSCVLRVVNKYNPLMFVTQVTLVLLPMVACCVVAAGLHMDNRRHNGGESDAGHFIHIFLFTLVTLWGSMVAMNMTVVAYAGLVYSLG